ncbi:tigger transposable element-derived protein 1-like [Zootermopsis nevadensis]|uniref:tigger transposable element-derived protein 1-like n=1 Tax=Zootermopsis nevadensis TaxID=136037 RepID=UPI000B8E7F9F|nr:tigger transposable element-derived protein 1-like [Zootermopsis nevadensis]
MGPKRNSSTGADGGNNKRRSISLETKLDIIKRTERGQKQVDIARHYGVNRSSIATIIKDKERIVEAVKEAAPVLMSRIVKNRNFLLHEMEKLLILWIERQTRDHVPLGSLIIQEKARSLFEDLKKIAGPEYANDCFSASSGWFSRFKRRANLHNLRLQGKLASADTETASEFLKSLEKIIVEGGYNAHQVFSVGETGLFWKRMPSRTYISREEKCAPGHKFAKERLTLLLGGNAAGDFKLKPLLVYLSENPRALKGTVKSSLPVIWKSNTKALMTMELFEDWFKNYFVGEMKRYCASKNLPFKILLLLDNAPGHPYYIADFNDKIKIVLLPPNTSIVQPMDRGITASFKAYYLRRIFSQAIAFIDREKRNLRDFWKAYNIYNALQNIAGAWGDVKEMNLSGVWKNLCPQFVDNLSDFEEPVESVTEEIVELGNKMDLDLDVTDVKELLDSRFEELTTDELIEKETHLNLEVKEESDIPQPPRTFTRQKMAAAFKSISEGLAIFEEEDANMERIAKVKRGVYDCLACYSEIFEGKKKRTVQTSIETYFKKVKNPAVSSVSDALPSTSSAPMQKILNPDEDIDE